MKAVIFDFNGTLFNDTRFHVEAWQRYMHKKFGIDLTLEEVHRSFIGPNNSAIFRSYFGDRFTDAEVEEMGREKEAEYRAVASADPANMHLMEGAPELFDLLVERNIPFALATASAIDNINFYLNELGMKKWFTMDRIVYDEGKLPSKPDPAFYIEAMRRLDMPAQDCVIVEDSPSGIQAAINAGAGRIIAIDRTAPLDWLRSKPEIHALIHDYYGFERYL